MAEKQGGVTVTLDSSDRVIDRVLDYTVESSYMTPADAFQVTFFDENVTALRGLELEPVTIKVDGRPTIIGRIEITRRGGNGTEVAVSGRDYIGDLIECHVDPSVKVTEGMTVFAAISLALKPIGIDTVVSADDILLRNIRTGRAIGGGKVTRDFEKAKLDDYKPKAGEGVFEFVDRIAARHGATIQPADDRRKICLGVPQYDQSPSYRAIRRTNENVSNVLSSEATRDLSHFPTHTLITGKGGGKGIGIGALSFAVDMADLAENIGGELAEILREKVIPGRILPAKATELGLAQVYRLHYTKDTDSKKREQLEKIALRQVSEHLKDSLQYSVTFKGHSDPDTGATYAVDTLIDVDDDVCDVHENLWIESVTHTYDQDGPRTTVEAWRPGSFQIT